MESQNSLPYPQIHDVYVSSELDYFIPHINVLHICLDCSNEYFSPTYIPVEWAVLMCLQSRLYAK